MADKLTRVAIVSDDKVSEGTGRGRGRVPGSQNVTLRVRGSAGVVNSFADGVPSASRRNGA
jgi:hypothetical protein